MKRAAEGIRTLDPELGKLWVGGQRKSGKRSACKACLAIGKRCRACRGARWVTLKPPSPGCYPCAILRTACSNHRKRAAVRG